MSQSSSYPLHLHPSHVPWWSWGDDWQGMANTGERRKIQNRINQRARRFRRRKEAEVSMGDSNYAHVARTDSPLTLRHAQPVSTQHVDFEKVEKAINIRDPQSWATHPLILAFEAFIYQNWLISAPRPALLPDLIQFNYARAIMANGTILGLTSSQLHDDAISYFHVAGPWPVGVLPAGLQPTDLQRRALHHPWLDMIPIPQMRDNLMRRGVDSFDDEHLCHAMRGHRDGSDAGFLVWGDSWDSSGWEVTESFARSWWGWTISGCWELFRSTNKWRAQRGEPPLFYSHTRYHFNNP
ncbi:hypothetical protein E0Z10_g7400 [Xylaria hypoxylon]|uniref:BZIP domain-containing protein n=1 Tax=Xylaria hypoxylon TaxID=37992 RepID=A0A4Z0YQA2_9PEZI|nr:hypothetical protein E0Z10_g7400 [Xylaria hypoxylon]